MLIALRHAAGPGIRPGLVQRTLVTCLANSNVLTGNRNSNNNNSNKFKRRWQEKRERQLNTLQTKTLIRLQNCSVRFSRYGFINMYFIFCILRFAIYAPHQHKIFSTLATESKPLSGSAAATPTVPCLMKCHRL